jgi:hypothetical protein
MQGCKREMRDERTSPVLNCAGSGCIQVILAQTGLVSIGYGYSTGSERAYGRTYRAERIKRSVSHFERLLVVAFG